MNNHLTDMEIAAWQGNSFHGDDRIRVGNHLKNCTECRQKVQDIREVMQNAESVEVPEIPDEIKHRVIDLGGIDSGKKFLGRGFYRITAVAASLLLAALILQWQPWKSESVNQLRSTDGVYDIELSHPEEHDAISRTESFEWKELEYAVFYRFSVYDEDGTLIYQDEMRTAEVGAESVTGLKSETAYFWKVEAIGGDGTVLQSPLRAFRFAPGNSE